MNGEINQTVSTQGCEVQISSEPRICALSQRYASRGVVKAVMDSAAEQIAQEEQTRELAPDAYRLSLLSDSAINGIYRHGKSSMSTPDLLRYVEETRAMRVKGMDFFAPNDESRSGAEASRSMAVRSVVGINARSTSPLAVKELPGRVCQKCKEGFPAWFDIRRADTSSNQKRFPLSAFAAVAAIATSLMLIVASSVMVTQAESRVNSLNVRVDRMTAEVADLQSNADIQNDLIRIRDIAVNEYGMISEEFIKTDYVVLRQEDSVETYEEEEAGSVGLGALLSAIGIDIDP